MNEILAAWQWNGSVSEPIPYGEGHINQTYAITVMSEPGAKRYILQKINTDTFKDPEGLMENICGVTEFLRERAKQRGADPARATLHVVPTKEEQPYYQAADGSCWRVYGRFRSRSLGDESPRPLLLLRGVCRGAGDAYYLSAISGGASAWRTRFRLFIR